MTTNDNVVDFAAKVAEHNAQVLVDEALEGVRAEYDAKFQAMQAKQRKLLGLLCALVRDHGRLRIAARDLAAVSEKASLDVKVQDNGDVIVTYVP